MSLPIADRWRKSSYSNGMGGECVEVAVLSSTIAVRDSKSPAGPFLSLSVSSWRYFLDGLPDSAIPRR